MAPILLPDLVISTDSIEDGIKELFKKVKPGWNQGQIIVKKMSGGFSCVTSCVYLDENPDDAYTVKVRNLLRGKSSCLTIKNTEFEVKVVQELSKIGQFPTVHAVFDNGYCYEYIRGKPITNSGAEVDFEQKIKKAMVEKLAEINSIKLENEDYSKTNFFTNFEIMLKNSYPNDDLDLIDKSIISKEFYELLNYSKEFDLKIVLCHGDAHPGNVVWNREDDKMTYVDWELAHIGYQAYDVAYCVQIIHFKDIMPVPGFHAASKEKESSDESRKEIIKWYFQKWSELNSLEFDEESFREFLRQVTFFELVWCITFIILFGTILNAQKSAMADLPASPILMVQKTYEHYCTIKEKRLQDLKLK